MAKTRVRNFDALIIVDMQNDFMPGGALPVPEADKIVDTVNAYIDHFVTRGALVVATRDWHPPNHISFAERGGPWPPHCVQNTWGAQFHPNLRLPESAIIVSKAFLPDKEAYSGFDGTDLEFILRSRGIRRVFIAGVATDYCVRATALDAVRLGFETFLLVDAVKGVDIPKGSIEKALNEMLDAGIVFLDINDFER